MPKTFLNRVEEYSDIGLEELERRSKALKADPGFSSQVKRLLTDIANENKDAREDDQSQIYREPEERLYSDGFSTPKDSKIMKQFHFCTNWNERYKVSEQFENMNLRHLAKIIIYEESPESLPEKTFERIKLIISQRIMSENDEKWNTIKKAYDEIHRLREKYFEEDDEDNLLRLEDIEKVIISIEQEY